MNGFRSKGRVALGASAVAVALALLVAGPVSATEGIDTPDWYLTAGSPQYTDGAPPAGVIDSWSDADSSVDLSFWALGGRSPGEGRSDATISVSTTDPEFTQVYLGDSSLVASMGSIVDVFAPAEADGTPQSASIEFDKFNTFTVRRPPISSGCNLSDASKYQSVTVIALSQDRRKYVFKLDVTFGDRSVEMLKQCAKGIVENSKPTATPSATPTPTASEIAPIKAGTEKTDPRSNDPGGIFLVLGGGFMVVTIIAFLALKRSRGKYENDGRLHGAVENNSSTRTKYGR